MHVTMRLTLLLVSTEDWVKELELSTDDRVLSCDSNAMSTFAVHSGWLVDSLAVDKHVMHGKIKNLLCTTLMIAIESPTMFMKFQLTGIGC